MTVDLARFGWMIPFALFGLNGGLALLTGLGGALFHHVKRSHLTVNWLLFSLSIFASELLRSHLLTGFPWNLQGYSWGVSDISIQAASLLSITPLTLLTIALAASCALWNRRLIAVSCMSIIIGLHGYGVMRLQDEPIALPDISARIVQANIPQSLKWDPTRMVASFRKHVGLSINPSDTKPPKLIIWAESAFPEVMDIHASPPARLFQWLRNDQILITGVTLTDSSQSPPLYWNSIAAFNHSGEMLARYDKRHLVPFGEYVPFQDYLPIKKLTHGSQDFRHGSGKRLLAIGDRLLFHALICYEAIFPQHADADTSVPADMILNLTNDDWFGYSSGPFQHFTMTRFRAVEQKTPLIRVANSGISAIVDAYGRIQQQLPLHETGTLTLDPNRSEQAQ